MPSISPLQRDYPHRFRRPPDPAGQGAFAGPRRSVMKLAIDKNVPIPAYQQVVDGISLAVERGDLIRGARLPSVRTLAVDLGLNVNTVARAYRDLERAGVVDTMPG